jgi:hypothetical protein
MYNSKKAQISDTISWMVATVIIILILSIPLFLIQFNIFDTEISFYRSQDLLIAKSFSGYFLKNEQILKEAFVGEFSELSNKEIDSFLNSLSRRENIDFFEGEINIYESLKGKEKKETIYSNLDGFKGFLTKLGLSQNDCESFYYTYFFEKENKKIRIKLVSYFHNPYKKYPVYSSLDFFSIIGGKND